MAFRLVLSITFLLILKISFAQTQDTLKDGTIQPVVIPVPIELFAGNKALTFQLVVSKQFSPASKFGFFNVTNFSGDYKEVNQASDFFSLSFLTAEVWKGISLAAGLATIGSSSTPLSIRPTAGLQYLFANQKITLVVLPRFDLTQTYNFETFAMFEYKPMVSKNWGIYTRLQGLYNYNTQQEFHEISSIYARLGLSYKNVQFGLGTNQDFYGPDNARVSNYGVFIKTNLY